MTTIRLFSAITALLILSMGTAFAHTGFRTVLQPDWNVARPDSSCPNQNQPAPAGDSCSIAPFFCGNYLDGYCGTNAGATPDAGFNLNGFNCFPIENNVWLRFSPCEPDVKLEITAKNCQNALGLESGLFAGPCTDLTATTSCITLQPDQTSIVSFNNLNPESIYWLMIDGVQGDVCDFSIRVLQGVGTAPTPATSCTCIPGYVDGPSPVCPNVPATYQLRLPSCAIIQDSITGGNGLYCLPPPSICPVPHDTTLITWHLPVWLNFVGDSTGMTINTHPNAVYLGLDTIIFNNDTLVVPADTTLFDTIRVDITIHYFVDSTQIDSLAFCDCPGLSNCAGTILPFPVQFKHKVVISKATLTCTVSSINFHGQTITDSGIYSSDQDPCITDVLLVDVNKSPPPFVVHEIDLHDGTYIVVVDGLNGHSTVSGISGAQNGNTFTSAPILCGSAYGLTITDTENGCTATTTGMLNCMPCSNPLISIKKSLQSISCCGIPVLSITTNLPIAGVFWQGPGGLSSGANIMAASQPGSYTAIVTVPGGCTATASIQIQSDFNAPAASLPPSIVICQGESTTFGLNNSGNNLNYLWNTGNTAPQVTVQPPGSATYTVTVTNLDNCCTKSASTFVNVQPVTVQDLGVVGTLDCTHPCFNYNGVDYCVPGDYQQQPGACSTLKFKIIFQKEIKQLGALATLNCYQPCYIRNGVSYCQGGSYTDEDDCNIFHFDILEDKTPPQIENLAQVCTPSNTSFVVSFQINGAAPFYVNSSIISGSSYLSDPIISGSPYVFIVKSGSNGCEKTVSGTYSCDFACGNTAGKMSGKTIHACIDGLAVSTYLGGAMVDTGSIERFILYIGDPLAGGSVYAENSTGQFVLPAGLLPGQTCYIAHIVGKDSGNGSVDLTDHCTRISTGQPVVFYAVPGKPGITLIQPRCLEGAATTGQATVLNTAGGWTQFAIDGQALQTNNTFTNLSVGIHIISSIDSNTCRVNDTIKITPPANPLVLDLGPEKTADPCATVELQAVTNGVPASIHWSTNAGELYTGGLNWTTSFDASREVYLQIRDTAGCIVHDSLAVKISENRLGIPNAFTPNGDGLNDEFKLLIRCPVRNFYFRIFDRWGKPVFETDNQEAAWNGIVQLNEAPSDVYFWIADFSMDQNGQLVPFHLKGDVTLLR
jgi:gliding motility-associated-like protein